MLSISTHVLDTATGKPAANMGIVLQTLQGGVWKSLKTVTTNADGRVGDLLPKGEGLPGMYRVVFSTAEYFQKKGSPCFYPEVTVWFEVAETNHHHIPLLVSPFGYSTYRGS